MKFFEKLKGKYDLARWALKRAREAEAQVDELLQLCEEKDKTIQRIEQVRDELLREKEEAAKENTFWRVQSATNLRLCKMYQADREKESALAEAYARLKVDADVMRQEIKEYRRRLFEKEQGNAGNDRGE